MDHLFEFLKPIIMAVITSVVASIANITATFTIMIIMFTADFIFGIAAGWIVNNECFKWKKGLIAGLVLVIYASIVALVAIIGHLLGDVENSKYAVKLITYLFIYITGTNTLKNLCKIFPNARLFYALYWILSLEFAKKFPELYNKIKDNTEK